LNPFEWIGWNEEFLPILTCGGKSSAGSEGTVRQSTFLFPAWPLRYNLLNIPCRFWWQAEELPRGSSSFLSRPISVRGYGSVPCEKMRVSPDGLALDVSVSRQKRVDGQTLWANAVRRQFTDEIERLQ
jgi:hypothetical protein